MESLRRRRRDPLDALAPGRPALRRLPRLRLRRGVHGDRRQHRPLRRRRAASRPAAGSRTRSRRTTSRRSRRSCASCGCATSAGSSSSTSSTWRTRRTGPPSRRRCKTELERDRTKTYVVEISPLGLVEMTRQNVTDGPREILTRKCTVCGGDGVVLSEASAAVDVERRLRALAASAPRTKAFKVELNAKVAAHPRSARAPPRLDGDRGGARSAASCSSSARTCRSTTSRCSARARSRAWSARTSAPGRRASRSS